MCGNHACFRGGAAGVLPVVYAVRGGSGIRKAGAWHKVGADNGGRTMCDCVGMCVCGQSFWIDNMGRIGGYGYGYGI